MSLQPAFGLDGAADLQDFDIGVIREFIEFFPENGLSKVLKGYLSSGISQFPLKAPQPVQEGQEGQENGSAEEGDAPLSPEDCLLLMADGVDEAKDSVLSHRLMGEYYLFLEEYESAVEIARKGLKLVSVQTQKTGLKFQRILDALNSTLATSLIHYQSPKNHPEAKEIFQEILKRRPTFTPALIGIGLILEEEEEYVEAIDFLERALTHDASNSRIGAEVAWCQALTGDYATGLRRLEEYLEYPQMDSTDPRGRELKAQTLYRIGICLWELDSSKSARKDRQRAYSKFLAAIKANVSFAPAYTSLGIFYSDYAKDRKRARQCFQKAFELSTSEIEAAERLARHFADQGEWDIVEVIAQRVVNSGKVKPAPGSKKKGVSWPFSALGVVQMNKQEYPKSIVSFLSALRISPDDYHSYVGLGESYHNSGRYNSAARTFRYAENPTDAVQMKKTGESWFTKYMLANVNRELGEYDEAIQGYEEVLKDRPKEFGVSIALLQTLIERAWRSIETGFYGKAADSTIQAIDVAITVAEHKPDAFNLWKAVGDACGMFSWVQSRLEDAPFAKITALLKTAIDLQEYDMFADADGIGQNQIGVLSADAQSALKSSLSRSLYAAILAQKRSIISCAHDVHAQAVAWYNLGWAEYRAHVCLEQSLELSHVKKATKFLKASMKCFKRAIELEAGNAEFWNSLGVMTTAMNPKVAQHSFVRSIHLNEKSARTWTNLGTLYLLQNDLELSHMAFSRAQSTDPDYGQAWLGEGLIALLWGDPAEALSHFTHAFEISDSTPLIAKRLYAVSTFDHLISSSSAPSSIVDLIQPLFSLQQLSFQKPTEIPYRHLAALYLERVGNHDAAIECLASLCSLAETEYEESESQEALSRFAQAKTDLARNRLAVHDYEPAAEDAETALDLASDPDSCGMSLEVFKKTRLSAHLTVGLSHYYLNNMDAALGAFRIALEESNSAPDIVCLLAEVLWAKGGEDEKNVAREQLFESVEKHPEHVGSVVLLGAMAALDEDPDTMDAVKEDLQMLRTKSTLDAIQLARVEKVLDSIAFMNGGVEEAEKEVKRNIVLSPSKAHGWAQLADFGEDIFPAQMALRTAEKAVPPLGPLSAVNLATAFAGTGSLGDAQRAIALAPWVAAGWNALAESLQ
ncbi:protein prenylyltransferase [Glonium stellatum]|uniref:Protein prenylyltransferase n=1 Tax=Glonium stellatum TaxID=574774 RepID=A0A8E2F7Z2_9PEZI|nr:protein prenylyltransferase [Glonium stellatum]